jgi:transcriptional regulator with XRE-family HTH domain
MAITFGERIRELRRRKKLTLRGLSAKVGVGFTYISKIENAKLGFGDHPSEDLIRKLASVLEVDEDEMLILAGKIPEQIKRRVFERPEVFRALARCDDKTLDQVLAQIGQRRLKRKAGARG